MNQPNYRSALSRAGFGLNQHSNNPGQWYISCAPLGQLQPFGSIEEAVMYGVQLLISALLDHQRAAVRRNEPLPSEETLAPFRVLPNRQLTPQPQAGTRFVAPHAHAYLRQHNQTGAWAVVTSQQWFGPFANTTAATEAARLRGLVVCVE